MRLFEIIQPSDSYSDEWKRAEAKGLPTDPESRMARAAAMGFDIGTIWYHGTQADEFTVFKKIIGKDSTFFGSYDVSRSGFFFAVDQKLAQEFADQGGRKGRSIETLLKTENTYDASVNGFDNLPESFFEKHGLNQRYYYNLYLHNTWMAFNDEEGGNEFVQALQKEGYDSVKLQDYSEGNVQDTTSMVVFNPSQIRSINAVFDPSKASSGNLLEDYLL